MRHAQLIITWGGKSPSKNGMPRIPWRKGKRWSTKPVGVIEPHKHMGSGHSGIPGQLPKGKRLKTGPPGSPRGVCIELNHPKLCYCGKHIHIRREGK